MRFLFTSLLFLMVVRVAGTCRAHDDIVPYPLNGTIVTGGHDDGAGTNTIVERVFGYDFGEDPFDPPTTYFAGDPGFNNDAVQGLNIFPNDGALPANKTLGFNLLTNLSYWDGTGGVAFSPAPAGVSLGINRGPSTVNIFGADPPTGTVPSIGGTGAAGRLHEHLGSYLNFDGSIDPSDPNAPDGIYMVSIELKLPGSGLANSAPLYIVYNNHLDEELHDEAIAWVEAHLVPEPSSLAITSLAGGGIAIVGRFRLKRRARLR